MFVVCREYYISSFYNNKKEEKRTQLVLNQYEQRVVYAIYYGL
jgi:hypothetical protein